MTTAPRVLTPEELAYAMSSAWDSEPYGPNIRVQAWLPFATATLELLGPSCLAERESGSAVVDVADAIRAIQLNHNDCRKHDGKSCTAPHDCTCVRDAKAVIDTLTKPSRNGEERT